MTAHAISFGVLSPANAETIRAAVARVRITFFISISERDRSHLLSSIFIMLLDREKFPKNSAMKVKFLHTNDFHGKLDDQAFATLADLRKECDFYFDSGDAIKAGNLAIPLTIDPVWMRLAELNCTASVLGNRETHPLRMAFEKKIAGHSHPLLAGNLVAKDGTEFLPATLVLDFNGKKIGVISTMVAMVTARMKTQAASAFLWNDPIETAIRLSQELRPQVDLLVALTHIGFKQDQVLAQQCGDIDIIFGGHSHTVLEQPVKENHTWIVQGGSHGRFAGKYEWEDGLLSGGLVSLRRSRSQS
jgi:5'-nucleotidase